MTRSNDTGFLGTAGSAVLSGLLSLAFFLLVTPVGLVLRALGKDVLKLRRDPGAKTYWVDRKPPGPEPKSMIRQY
jgi:hypothetical protein